jgi:hypothetical protein
MQRAHQSAQLELELSTVLSHSLFPGRSTLKVAEVANALRVDDQHIFNLVEEGRLTAIDVRNGELTTASKLPKGSRRRWLRIPVSAYDAFIRARATTIL